MSNNSFSVTGPPGFSSVFRGIPSYIGRSLVSFSNRIARTYHFAGRKIDICGVNNVVDDVDISSGATVIANRPKLSCYQWWQGQYSRKGPQFDCFFHKLCIPFDIFLQGLLVREECMCEHSVVFIVPRQELAPEGPIDVTRTSRHQRRRWNHSP